MKTILSLTIVLVSFDEAYVTTSGDTLKVKGTDSYVLELIKEVEAFKGEEEYVDDIAILTTKIY